MRIHWHRDDLRVHDNPAYSVDETVQPVFVFDPEVLRHASDVRVGFLLDSLEGLRTNLRDRGGDLLIRRGYPSEIIPEVAGDGDTVTWNQGYSPLARQRQQDVAEALQTSGVGYQSFDGGVIHGPTEIYSDAGDPYSVFSYYHRSWLDLEKPDPYGTAEASPRTPEETDVLPDVENLGFTEPEAEVPRGGSEEGLRVLDGFCSEDIYRYGDLRDRPDFEATSRLSPHLKFGTVGARRVWREVAAAFDSVETEVEQENVDEYRRQLCFREFYTQMLYHHPETTRESYRAEPDWRTASEEVERWRRGETGYPFVDAGMRQLLEEAWMHNRSRMVAASFLTRHLLVDWRVGLDWFRRKLVDHSPANDVAGWQWAASTGVDAQPYFRVFNPITQCRDHDPEAEYVRRYVPELRDVSTEDVHRMPEMTSEERSSVAPEYVEPVVEHEVGRERALEAFERIRD